MMAPPVLLAAKVYGKNRALEKVCVFGIISNI